jgi:hypothetical protein
MKSLWLVAVLAVGACASTQSLTLPDGRVASVVDCSNTWSSWPACHEAARKSCGGNYEVVRQTEYARGIKPIRELTYVCEA